MLRDFTDTRRKIAFIGASYRFVHQAVRDFLVSGLLENTDIVLYDIDKEAEQLEHDLVSRMIRQKGSAITVDRAGSRAAALDGANYVIVSVMVGAREATGAEYAVCREFGITQTVGDTIGPMWASRSLRTVPLLLDIAEDMERYCPQAPLLSVTNPMTVLTGAVNRHTRIACFGICHGTGEQVKNIAAAFGAAVTDVSVDVVGVNHLGFITRIEIKGEEIPTDQAIAAMGEVLEKEHFDATAQQADEYLHSFRFFELTKLLPNNSDFHFTEFFPWFLAKHAFADGANVYGLNGSQLYNNEQRIRNKQNLRERITEMAYAPEERGIPGLDRYGEENILDIILGLEHRRFAKVSELHLNTTNGGAVPNLPADANLELTCHVTPRGIQPIRYDPLPPYPLGVLMPIVCANELCMKAAVQKDKQAFIETLLLDPLLQEFNTVEQLADRLWELNEKWWTPVK